MPLLYYIVIGNTDAKVSKLDKIPNLSASDPLIQPTHNTSFCGADHIIGYHLYKIKRIIWHWTCSSMLLSCYAFSPPAEAIVPSIDATLRSKALGN